MTTRCLLLTVCLPRCLITDARGGTELSGMAVVGCGCSSPHQTAPRYSEGETEQSLDVRIIQATQKWYAPHDENVRVVVKSRSPSGWMLNVGPEMKESTVEIDPTTLQIVNFWPGY